MLAYSRQTFHRKSPLLTTSASQRDPIFFPLSFHPSSRFKNTEKRLTLDNTMKVWYYVIIKTFQTHLYEELGCKYLKALSRTLRLTFNYYGDILNIELNLQSRPESKPRRLWPVDTKMGITIRTKSEIHWICLNYFASFGGVDLRRSIFHCLYTFYCFVLFAINVIF